MSSINVITLCGSRRFVKEFEKVEKYLTLKGNVVLTPVFYHQRNGLNVTQEEAQLLGKIHFKKIDLSDEIFVIDVESYIGESTKKEIAYAKQNNKRIRYYSKEI